MSASRSAANAARLSPSSSGLDGSSAASNFLSRVLPPVFRFGSGDATDVNGNRSGQLDVVIEYPFAPTLPAFAGETRLYLAEGVAAVVEVKSNAANQWHEVEHTAAQLAPLRRSFWAISSMGFEPPENIPLFVAGYTGWKTVEPIREKLKQNSDIAGVLVIDSGIFVSSADYDGLVVK